MTLHPPRSRFWRLSIYFVCLLLVLLALDMLWAHARRRIRPGYATTRIVEPRTDDGAIDYLTAIETYFSRGVTRDNNAFPLLLEALGRQALPRTQPPDGITARLGMPHLPEKGDYFVTINDFTKARAANTALTQPTEVAQPDDYDFPNAPSAATVAWLAVNEKPLARIRAAVDRPRYFVPFNGGNRPDMIFSVLLPHLNGLREATRALHTRALVRAASGDADGAIDDILTMHRLARLLGQAATLVERSVANGADIEAAQAARKVAVAGKFSQAQLHTLADALAALPDPREPGECVDNAERFIVLDATMRIARLGPSEAGRMYHAITTGGSGSAEIPPPATFWFLPIPYEQTMIAANQGYDGLLTALRQPTFALRRDAMRRWEKDIDERATSNHVGLLSPAWALHLFMPSLSRFELRWETARAESRLTRIAVALELNKAEHNAYPSTLADLAPTYVKALPTDNFTDRPFVYAKAGTGYTLYSVGPNLADDGGSATAPADDIDASLK